MEMTPELIEMVTRQVLAALGESCPVQSGPKALALGGDWPELQGEYTLEGAAEFQVAGSLAEYELVLLAEVSPGLLADLALGRGSCPAAQSVAQALLTGKPVYLVAEGLTHRRFRGRANPRYYDMLEEYAAQLERFGVQVAPRTELVSRLTGAASSREAPTAQVARCAPGLLTADEARRLCRAGGEVVRVPVGTVVTPLARDVLREKHVRLEEEEIC